MALGTARKKVWKPRTRTGCTTCRKAKVKCMEQKPTCIRCDRLGFNCIYGPPTIEKPRGPRMILPASDVVSTASLIPPPSVSNQLPGDDAYFDHFRNHAVHILSDERPGLFWQQTVLREAAQDGCIADCINGISALMRAASHNQSNLPLFQVPLSSSPLSYHYRKAINYYMTALRKFRQLLSSQNKAVPPRLILITAILFTTFELIHGNTEACDRITATTLFILNDKLLHRANADDKSLPASPLDDLGVFDAEYYLTRTAAFNSIFSPLYPQTTERLQYLNLHGMSGVDPIDLTHSLDSFWSGWWRMMTLTVVWFHRILGLVKRGYPIDENSKIMQQHKSLITKASCWLAPAQERLAAESDPDARYLIKVVICGIRIVCISLRCGVDPSGATWEKHAQECLEIVTYVREVVTSRDLPSGPMINDGLATGMIQIARECRDWKTRSMALETGRLLVRAGSSWDMKAIYMGTCALVAAEEPGRNSKGRIPLDRQYDWVSASWDYDSSRLRVTLVPKVVGATGFPEQKHVIVRLDELGLALNHQG